MASISLQLVWWKSRRVQDVSGKATTVLKAEATWLDEGEEYAQAKMVEAFGVTFDTDLVE